jgi:hypothetical protein
MKSFIRRLAVLASLIAAPVFSSAAVVSYELDWTGAGGYSASGSFSFDTATIGGDNLITEVDLTAFTISFFSPASTLLKAYSALSDAQRFAFHTNTLAIDQGPSINLILGRIGVSDYLLIRGNGCNGDNMVLYQGNGLCPPIGTFLDRAGTVTASPAGAVPEPESLQLIAMALLGVAFIARRRRA